MNPSKESSTPKLTSRLFYLHPFLTAYHSSSLYLLTIKRVSKMADYDRRQGGGGSNPRKRRYRGMLLRVPKLFRPHPRITLLSIPCNPLSSNIPFIPDDEDHYNPQREHRGPHRRRNEPPVPVRLRKQLLDIADSPLRGATEEARAIAQLLADNYDDLRLRETFLELSLQLIVEQPLKTPFVAAVALVLNTLSYNPPKPQQSNGSGEDGGDAKMDEAGDAQKEEPQPQPQPCTEVLDDMLARVTAAVEEKAKVGDWRTVKLYLKLLACLQNALDGEGVFPILDALFDRAVELQTASSEDVSTLCGRSSHWGIWTDISDDRRLELSWSRSSSLQYPTPSLRPLANSRRMLSISSTRRTSLLLSLMRFRP